MEGMRSLAGAKDISPQPGSRVQALLARVTGPHTGSSRVSRGNVVAPTEIGVVALSYLDYFESPVRYWTQADTRAKKV
jgi:hypothetical protein